MLSSLEVLAVEKDLAGYINLNRIISDFTLKKDRKGTI